MCAEAIRNAAVFYSNPISASPHDVTFSFILTLWDTVIQDGSQSRLNIRLMLQQKTVREVTNVCSKISHIYRENVQSCLNSIGFRHSTKISYDVLCHRDNCNLLVSKNPSNDCMIRNPIFGNCLLDEIQSFFVP